MPYKIYQFNQLVIVDFIRGIIFVVSPDGDRRVKNNLELIDFQVICYVSKKRRHKL